MSVNTIHKLVLIASSTGGPKALQRVIPFLNKNLDAPVIIVQHMPKGFTASLAERLNDMSDIKVTEAVDGEILEKGHVYIAKGGKHLKLKKDSKHRLLFCEDNSDPVNGLKPCANITFASAVSLDVPDVTCVVLTGMGSDGYEGIKQLKEHQKIYTIAQNQETCIVYGMPKAIVEHGIADDVLSLDEIGKEITRKVGVF